MFAVNPADSLGYRTRNYRVHVPVSYQNTIPTALVLYFHGFGGTASQADRISGFTLFSEKHNILVAYGQGLPEGEGGAPFWASAGPIDYGIDDLHYVSLMLDDLQNKLCVDTRRIFVTGFSNGGGMSGYIACSLAGRIAAVAPVSGNFYALPGGCHPGPTIFLHSAQEMGERWANCQENAEIVHYRIEGGGHAWPRLLGNRPSLEVMWDFFQSHPLPEQV
jgi:polyhydroxybutyrate depolymerase